LQMTVARMMDIVTNGVVITDSIKFVQQKKVELSKIAPCPWTYYEISEILNKKEIRTEAFKQWIGFNSSEESLKQVNEIIRLERIGDKRR
jgi:thiaminase